MDTGSGRILWTIAGITMIGLLALGLIFGPTLYREGRAFVGPIMELANSEEEFANLNLEMPFTADPDGLVDEARFETFLKIREELLPHYERWAEVESELKPGNQESFEDAKLILGTVTEVLGLQTSLLRQHKMSPAEFAWLETQIYDNWADAVNETDSWGNPALKQRLREWLDEDLKAIEQARRQHGDSEVLNLIEQHLRQRSDRLEGLQAPQVDSVPDANEALFWRHAERIEALDFSRHAELHSRFHGEPGNNFKVEINN